MTTEKSTLESAQLRAHKAKAANDTASTLRLCGKKVLAVALADVKVQRKALQLVASRLEALYEQAPSTTRKAIAKVQREVSSLRQGVRDGLVTATDMVLTSLPEALSAAEASAKVVEAYGSSDSTQHADEWEAIIRKNAKYKAKLQKPGSAGFTIARVPTSLTFVRNMRNKHSSVGFLSLELLDSLGFKADMIAGYAVIYDQVVIGVDPRGSFRISEEDGVRTMKPKRIKETIVKEKDGKAIHQEVTRDMSALDLAKRVLVGLRKKTGAEWAFVSEKPHSHEGTSYFWVMEARDINRFAKAFPGKHIAMDKWGFAF